MHGMGSQQGRTAPRHGSLWPMDLLGGPDVRAGIRIDIWRAVDLRITRSRQKGCIYLYGRSLEFQKFNGQPVHLATCTNAGRKGQHLLETGVESDCFRLIRILQSLYCAAEAAKEIIQKGLSDNTVAGLFLFEVEDSDNCRSPNVFNCLENIS